MGRADQVTATTTQHLYERYGRQIYAYCLHQLRSREEAEDAVQTTFLNAFRSLKGGAVTHAEQAWLYKIAQNVCTARRSSAARRLRLETPNDFDVLQETIPAQNRESAVELIGLEDALEQMPENQRRAILLREWQGLSYREIGEQLELSQSSVEMLIFRARRTLAGALEQPAEEKKLKRKVGRTLNLGSVLAAIKSLLTGGAAVKAVALAVAAGAVSVTADAVQHTIVHSRQHRPAHNATTLSVAPQVAYSATSTPKAPVVSERPGSRVVKEQNAALTPRFDVQGTKARLAMDDVTVSPVATVVQATAPAPSSPQEGTPPTTASKEQGAPSQSSGAASAPSAPAPAAPAKRQDGPSQPSSASSAPAPSTNNQTQTGEGNDKKRKQQDNAGDPAAAQPIVTTTTTTPTSTTTTPTSTTPAPSTDDPRNGKQKKNDDPPVVTTPAVTTPVQPATTTTTPAPPPPDGHGNGKDKKNQDQPVVVTTPVVTTAAVTTPVQPATTTTTPAPPPPPDDHGNGKDKKSQDQPVVLTTPASISAPPAPVDSGKGKDHGK